MDGQAYILLCLGCSLRRCFCSTLHCVEAEDNNTHSFKLKPTAEKNVFVFLPKIIKSNLLKNISFKSFGEE